MATLNARANTYLATTGTTWSATSSAVDGAYGAATTTYAVFTNTTANAVGTIDVGFGTQLSTGLAAATSLNSATFTIRHLVSNATRIVSVTAQAFDGSTAIGSPVAGTVVASVHNDVITLPVTLAQLKSSTFKVRVSATRFNGTTAGTFSLDSVDLSVVHSIPKVETLVDKFTANIGAAWTDIYGGAVWEAGRVKCAFTAGGQWVGFGTTADAYDLTNSSVFAQITAAGASVATSRETNFRALNAAGDGAMFYIVNDPTPRALLMRKREGGGNTSPATIPYDPVAHGWLRISHSGTTLSWDASPDGTTWTNLWTATTTTNLTAVKVAFEASQYAGGDSDPGVGYFDNVNSVPVIPGAKIATLTDTFDTLDTGKWATRNNAVVTAGQLVATTSASGYSGVLSNAYYDLTESSVFVKLTPPSPADAGRDTSLSLYDSDVTNGANFFVLGATPDLMMRVRQGTNDNTTIPYDPVAHAWVRIALSGTTMTFDTSPDSQTWTNRRTATVDPTRFVRLITEMMVGGGANGQVAYYDNVNTVQVGGTVVQGTATVAGAGSVTAQGTKVLLGASPVLGAGTVSAQGTLVVVGTGTAVVAGAGAVTALSRTLISGTAAVAGAGSVTAVGTPISVGSATASVLGAGLVTAQSRTIVFGSAAVAGVGSVGAQSGSSAIGTATVVGAGTVAAQSRLLVVGTSAALGVGAVAAQSVRLVFGTAAVIGTGSVTAQSTAGGSATAAVIGVGVVTAQGRTVVTSVVVGVGTVTATAGSQALGVATISGTGAVTAAGSKVVLGSATVAGVGATAALSRVTLRSTAVVLGQGSVVAVSSSGVATTGRPKVYLGGSWQSKPGKVYISGSWQTKPWKRWNGSAWVPLK